MEDETQVPCHEERQNIGEVFFSNVTHIGDYAFKDCTKIKEREIFEWYNNVESIGAHAFEGFK